MLRYFQFNAVVVYFVRAHRCVMLNGTATFSFFSSPVNRFGSTFVHLFFKDITVQKLSTPAQMNTNDKWNGTFCNARS